MYANFRCQVLPLLLLSGLPAAWAMRIEETSWGCNTLEQYGVKAGLVIDNYELIECVRSNDFIETWKADTSGTDVALKILKTARGESELAGEALLKDCVFGHAMHQQQKDSFVDCTDVGSFTVASSPTGNSLELAYSVNTWVKGLTLEDHGAVQGVHELVGVTRALMGALKMAEHQTAENFQFFFEKLEPSSLMNGAHGVTILDYSEGVMCCVSDAASCMLGSDEMRKKLGLTSGKKLEACDDRTLQERHEKDAQLFGIVFLSMLCKPGQPSEPALSALMQSQGEEALVKQVWNVVRDSYWDQLNLDSAAKLQDVLKRLYASVVTGKSWGFTGANWDDFDAELQELDELVG